MEVFKVNNLKKKFVALLILGLLFNIFHLRYQQSLQAKEIEKVIEAESYQLYMAIWHVLYDSQNFIQDNFYYAELDDKAIEKLHDIIRTHHSKFNTQIEKVSSMTYLFRFMSNVIDNYERHETITREEMTFLVKELNRDLIKLSRLFIDIKGSGTYCPIYKRVYGLDPEFNKMEKEFMDGIFEKYYNFTVEDVEAAHATKIRR